MVLSPGNLFELPDLVIHRAWHPGYVELVYTKRPVECSAREQHLAPTELAAPANGSH